MGLNTFWSHCTYCPSMENSDSSLIHGWYNLLCVSMDGLLSGPTRHRPRGSEVPWRHKITKEMLERCKITKKEPNMNKIRHKTTSKSLNLWLLCLCRRGQFTSLCPGGLLSHNLSFFFFFSIENKPGGLFPQTESNQMSVSHGLILPVLIEDVK